MKNLFGKINHRIIKDYIGIIKRRKISVSFPLKRIFVDFYQNFRICLDCFASCKAENKAKSRKRMKKDKSECVKAEGRLVPQHVFKAIYRLRPWRNAGRPRERERRKRESDWAPVRTLGRLVGQNLNVV